MYLTRVKIILPLTHYNSDYTITSNYYIKEVTLKFKIISTINTIKKEVQRESK